MLKLIRNDRKELDCDEKKFIQIVKAGYNQRRKTLKNALKAFSLISSPEVKELFKKRAEELDVEDFITLTKNVQK